METLIITKQESTTLRMQWFQQSGRTKRYACGSLAAQVTVAYVECGVELLTQRYVYNGVVTHVCSNLCMCNGWVPFPVVLLCSKYLWFPTFSELAIILMFPCVQHSVGYPSFMDSGFQRVLVFPLCGVEKCVDKCKSGSPSECCAKYSDRVNWGHPFAFVNDTKLENQEA